MAEYHGLEHFHFGIPDYIVMIGIIILSTLIGVYLGYRKKKTAVEEGGGGGGGGGEPAKAVPPGVPPDPNAKTQFGSKAMEEYMLGSKELSSFPVAMSLVGSYISAVTILGTPPEMYNYGTQQSLVVLSIALSGVAVALIFLPVFMTLRVDSSYQYLEMRFNPTMRTLTSILFILDEIFFMPMIVYVPALALQQVTALNIYITSAVMVLCTVLYVILGGMKAVVYTDAWQIYVMFLAVVVVIIAGTIKIGFLNVITIASDGGRWIFFNFSPSLYKRYTFWSVLIGNFCYWTSFNSVNQTMVQRYLSLPTIGQARTAIAIFSFSMMTFESMCFYGGILIYAYYHACDPLTAGMVQKSDQLFPLFVMQTIGWLQGLPGLFIAGVFGAALSSLSVVYHSTSLVLFEDLAKNVFKIHMTDQQSDSMVKITTMILGVISFGLVYVVDKMGSIFSVAIGTTAIANSTVFGIFALGMLVPWSNWKGAIAGSIVGFMVTAWSTFGTQAMVAAGLVKNVKLELSVAGCPGNVSAVDTNYPDESGVFPFFRLSYLWVNLTGVVAVMSVGTIFSFITGPTKVKEMDAALFSPIIHRLLPRECFENSILNRERDAKGKDATGNEAKATDAKAKNA